MDNKLETVVLKMAALLNECRYELHCTPANEKELYEMQPDEHAYGHWCPSCDEFVDRNMETRKKIEQVLVEYRNLVGGA